MFSVSPGFLLFEEVSLMVGSVAVCARLRVAKPDVPLPLLAGLPQRVGATLGSGVGSCGRLRDSHLVGILEGL